MERAKLRPVNRWMLSVVLFLGACSAPFICDAADHACPHCSASDGVHVSYDSGSSLEGDGTVLSEVLVELPDGDCPHCGQAAAGNPGSSNPCDGLAGPEPWEESSVRDELAWRRAARHGFCKGARPRYQLRGGIVFMDRVTADERVLIESTSNPIRQLNAQGFDFDWEPGLDVSLRRVTWDDNQFEFRFLGLREFESHQQIDTEGSEVRIDSDPPVFAPDVQAMDARCVSDLDGFELNWHFVTYRPFNYVAGFRYLALDDELSVVMDADPQTYSLHTSTENHLYGAQLGIESVPEMPLFGWHCLTWFGKAGIFGNDARQRTVLTTNSLGQIVNESPETTAVVWEFGVGLDLPLGPCLSIQGGYSGLIVDRICTATDQLGHIDFLDATGSDNRGTLMFHGGTLSLVWER